MRLVSLLLKDMIRTIRNPKTVLLILTGPIFIMIILGVLFTNPVSMGTGSLSTVEIGICDMDNSNLSNIISSALGEQFNSHRIDWYFRNIEGVDNQTRQNLCQEELERALMEDRIKVGILIPYGFSSGIRKGEHQEVTVIVNNGNVHLTNIVVSTVQNVLGSVSSHVSESFISAVWEDMKRMDQNLGQWARELESSKTEMIRRSEKISEIKSQLDQIDTNKMREDLEVARNRLNELRRTMTDYRIKVGTYISYIDQLSSNLDSASNTLSEADSDLVKTKNDLIKTRADLVNVYEEGYCEHADDPEYANSDIPVIQKWRNMCHSIGSLINDIDNLIVDIDREREHISSLQSDIASSKSILGDTRADLYDLETQLSDTSEIDDMETRLSEMENTINTLEGFRVSMSLTLEDMEGSLKDSIDKADSNIRTLGDIRKSLSNVLQRPPKNVVLPFSGKYITTLKGIRQLDTFFPGIVAIVILMVTMLFSGLSVVSEKKSKTLSRILVSPTHPLTFVMSKMVITFILGMVQTGILVAIGLLVFNVRINWVAFPAFLALVGLLSFASSALGVILGVFSKSEDTVILGSIVVSIPMMFLSGLFLPIELMTPVSRAISQASPLTQAIIALNLVNMYTITTGNILNLVLSVMFLFLVASIGAIVSAALLRRSAV